MEQYRVNEATGEVHEYDHDQKAYIFIGNLNGRTAAEFIEQYEVRHNDYASPESEVSQ